MNHNPSDDSANVHPSGQAVVAGVSPQASVLAAAALAEENRASYHLNPSLQQALGCLDIKLEDELTRFRAKQEHRAPTEPSATVSEAILEDRSADFDPDADILTAEIVQTTTPETIKTDVEDTQPHPGGFTIVDGFSISATTSLNTITTVKYAQRALPPHDMSVTHENLDLNFSSGGEIAPFHDEYSSSSQELLRQIQSGYPAASEPVGTNTQSGSPTPKRTHLTPLKIGSMAAACVLAGGAVYTYLNPSILAPLTATKIVSPTVSTTNSLGQLIQSPNLAANEFTELNLSTLNTIKLPTAAPVTNVSTATTSGVNVTTSSSMTPAAIPFKGLNPQIMPPATIISQPRLADSLVRSLLPPNFHSFAKNSGYRTIQPGMRR
jgi:hypothetical protein